MLPYLYGTTGKLILVALNKSPTITVALNKSPTITKYVLPSLQSIKSSRAPLGKDIHHRRYLHHYHPLNMGRDKLQIKKIEKKHKQASYLLRHLDEDWPSS